ncbi:hypothetical protein [Dactylosporangium sp. CA-233914]|uniref:hypothetical protein n=1 Tax=Dactylosporangium sp. CA-233914 TaxID=3239934 RepID=UPI003D8F1DBF
MSAVRVAIHGDGQLGRAVAALLRERDGVTVDGPVARPERGALLRSGADLVVIATTTLLADVAADIEAAVTAGSNVIVSAEESSFPWAVDRELARRLDALARERGVTILGGGVNPGFLFDAFVLTLLGTTAEPVTLTVRRTVDLSRFGTVVLGRLGIGFPADEFAAGVANGSILGHAGFPQSMEIVAHALGLAVDRIDKRIEPLLTPHPVPLDQRPVAAGHSAGVHQIYTAIVAGRPWYTAHFTGHVDMAGAGLSARDEISVHGEHTDMTCTIQPGIGAQRGSAAMVANSVRRVLAAGPGWVTVADLPPAHP